MRQKREDYFAGVYENQKNIIGPISERDLFIAGLMLYWGEGGKTNRYTLTFSNTDSAMLRWYLCWLNLLGVPNEKIKIRLQLFSNMDFEKEMTYWKKELKVKKQQFTRPYYKQASSASISFYSRKHGTCNIVVHGKEFSDPVLMSLRYLTECFPK